MSGVPFRSLERILRPSMQRLGSWLDCRARFHIPQYLNGPRATAWRPWWSCTASSAFPPYVPVPERSGLPEHLGNVCPGSLYWIEWRFVALLAVLMAGVASAAAVRAAGRSQLTAPILDRI